MSALFLKILNMSISAGWLILAVIVLRLVLKKAPKWLNCVLWGMVAIRLICPFSLESALSLIPDAETVPMEIASAPVSDPIPSQPVSASTAETEFAGSGNYVPETESFLYRTEPATDGTRKITEPVAPVRTLRDWVGVFSIIWIAGFGALMLYAAVSYWRVHKKVSASIFIANGVYICDYIDSPFILGIVKPKIYLPSSVDPEDAAYVLAHERAHIRRKDHWWKPLGFVLLAVYWFNPVIWIAYILLCQDIELACDERVVKDMGIRDKKAYSAALLSCSVPREQIAACPLAFGEVGVKERVKNVLNYRKPTFWILLLSLLVIFVTAVCFLTNPAKEENIPADATQDAEEILSAENTDLNEAEMTAKRINDAFASIFTGDRYHLFFSDETYDGSVGWQIHFYKDGENTLWWSTDHRNEEGHMLYNSQDFTYVDGATSGWVEYKPEPDPLPEMLSQFDFDGKEITDITSVTQENESGYVYEKLTFTVKSQGADGEDILQPVSAFFTTDGEMTGIRIENTDRAGADIFSFTNWSDDDYGISEIFDDALHNIVSAEAAGPIEEPTEDEQLMKEWGIDFLVDDDRLTRSGSEVWFVQKAGIGMVVCTDAEYWLEKKTDTGWEKLPMIVEDPNWDDASYTLGTGMYTMLYTDWSKLYGDLPGGIYRMGKTFTNQGAHGATCTGYAEFEIFHNDSSTAEQTAAVEKCYAAIEEVKDREYVHYKVTTSEDTVEEVWWNSENYLENRSWRMPAENEDGSWIEGQYETLSVASASLDGIGYSSVHEIDGDLASKITGMKLSTLSADKNGWTLSSFEENLYLYSFEPGNEITAFPADDSCISSEKIRFHKYWSDPKDYSTLTFWFDQSGKLTRMEHETHYKDLDGYRVTFEIYDTSAAEIDAVIQSNLNDLIVESFSWADAKAEYTDDKYNIKENGFNNNDMVAITGPVEAALRAKQEYPNLGEYLSIDVFYDGDAGMWKVTFESYYDYQASYEYRDVYLDENGVTYLMVYEGPVDLEHQR